MDNVINVSEIEDFLKNIYNNDSFLIINNILNILNEKYDYVKVNEDILDYLYTQDEYTNNILVSSINSLIKNTIYELYNQEGFTVDIEENFNLSLDKHLDILKSLVLLKEIDLTSVFLISEIIHNDDLDNIEKIYNIFTLLNKINITIYDFLNLFINVHSKFIKNIINIINTISEDIVSINDSMYNIDELKEQSIIINLLTEHLNNFSIKNLDTDIINVITLPIIKDVTSTQMHKKYLSKIKLFDDMDDSIKSNIVITYLVLTLLLENFNDKENYLNVSKLKLSDSGLSLDLLITMDKFFIENSIYSYIERNNND